MRAFSLIAQGLAATLAASSACAQQPSETDRLRDALRSAIAQTRSLEDQRNALTARVTEAERKVQTLQTDLDAAKAEAKKADQDQRQAVTDFNARLEERNAALEKWKDAYGQAATVARAKDAERAKFEAESKDFQARNQNCTERNQRLAKVGRELLDRYRNVHFSDRLLAREPATGIKRVDVQNVLQDYGDRILDEELSK
ncbi:MAG: hypothetical protein DI565_07300 [Ancylobacter novellus]|uniref:Uncharacterized protein n=1 Tax=Ancylobacter novellus TaxID=921 RepID=A0A2W5KNX7_ANCNO|nr:MAG: hypothetical protein DI565_07300 [Ancylobacter novellus]